MPRNYLFDASAVVDVLVGEAGAAVSPTVLFGDRILDLTLYEAGNAVWKAGIAMDELGDDAFRDAMELLAALPRETTVETASTPGFGPVFDRAREEGLTFYDVAYLAVAAHHDLVLVTEDRALRKAAEGYVATETVGSFAE